MKPANPRGRSRQRRRLLFAAGLVSALLYAGYRLVLWRAVESALAELRAAGHPTSRAELDAAHPQGGAAEAFLAALPLVVEADEERFAEHFAELPIWGYGNLPPRGEPLPAGTRRAIEVYLEANAAALEALRHAATLEPSGYPVSVYFGSSPTAIPGLIRATCLLQLAAVHAVHSAETPRASEALAALLALGRSIEDDPLLLAYIVAGPLCKWGMDTLQDSLERVAERLEDRDLARLQAELIGHDSPERLRRVLIGERAFMIDSFRAAEDPFGAGLSLTLTRLLFTDLLRDAAAFVYIASGVRDIDLLSYLEQTARCLEIAAAPLPERLARWRALPPAEQYWEDLVERDLEHLSRARAATAALGVERARLVLGRLPSSPAEIPPHLPPWPDDPFDGQPLRYRLLERGYTAYSIGEDGVDGGGAGDDIAFRIER
jgi:hypothetical protein